MIISKQELNEWLHNQILTVTFKKVSDNSERVMVCTLLSEFLPEKWQEGHVIRIDDPNLMKVYDLDKHAWRSFKLDRVIEIKE